MAGKGFEEDLREKRIEEKKKEIFLQNQYFKHLMHLIEMVIEREKTIFFCLFVKRERIFVVENDEILVWGEEMIHVETNLLFIYSFFLKNN